ncbi:MAG: TRAP transporter small permease [Rhodocyclaceae bacterium]|nr:TRAP transporter small permease [Rhodocyclaceae bacterium]
MMARLEAAWQWFAESLAVVAFAVMFFGFVLGITARYVFGDPISWTNELSVIAYVWVVFWTSDILVRERQHIIFDVLYELFPPRARRWLAVFVTLSLAATFIAVLPGTLDYIDYLKVRHTTLLRLPMQLVHVSFLVFVVAVIVNALSRLWHLCRPGWEEYI